jgi:hypothetical protein
VTAGLVIVSSLVLGVRLPVALAESVPTPERPPSRVTGLAQQQQNPLSDVVNLAFEIDVDLRTGPSRRPQYTLQLEPVIPLPLGARWNLITRTVLPVQDQPRARDERDLGLGDTTFSAFVSPRETGPFVWGAGPILLLPTATATALGGGKWGAGPTAAAVVTRGPWVYGVLASQVWSFAGEADRAAVSLTSIEWEGNYTFDDGWSLGTSPTVTADWEAGADDRWTVPIGATVTKTLTLDTRATTVGVAAYWNAERPSGASDWQLQLTFSLLLPD